MIEVFKTNVKTKKQAQQLARLLNENFGYENINFDLDDSDKILRIKAPEILSCDVVGVLKREHFECEVLPDKPALT